MPQWLAYLLAPALATAVGSIFGGTKSKQTTSSTTDPFYALMSPKAIGDVLNRVGALQGAGFPSGAINFAGSNMLSGDLWKTILDQWPKIKEGMQLASASGGKGSPLATMAASGTGQSPSLGSILGGIFKV